MSLKVGSQTEALGCGSAKSNQPENRGQSQISCKRLEGDREQDKKKKSGGNDGWGGGEREMGVLRVTIKVSESWGPGAAIVRHWFGLRVSNIERDEAVVFDPIR